MLLSEIIAQSELIAEINNTPAITTKIEILGSVLTLRDHKLVLTYDQQRFQEHSAQYVSVQLQAHQTFRRELLVQQGLVQREREELVDSESSLQFWLRVGVPQNFIRELMKLYLAPAYLLSRTTFETGSARALQLEERNVKYYDFLKKCLLYGAGFFDTLTLDKAIGTVPIKIGACVTAAQEVAELYSKLSFLAEQRAILLRRERKFFFPESKGILK